FSDGGVNDNGNAIFGDGEERVDFIQWQTTQPVTLGGYEINFGNADGRTAQLVRFLVDGVEQDFFDNNSAPNKVERIFASGLVTGSTFRIELTRDFGGPRIAEINAIIPEPMGGTDYGDAPDGLLSAPSYNTLEAGTYHRARPAAGCDCRSGRRHAAELGGGRRRREWSFPQ
ncbi:MAG: hypothetical protein GXP35_16630, partial [Actinobacteria bacterium]|nr:hypothetical protein [Actinomycetota bacterium]